MSRAILNWFAGIAIRVFVILLPSILVLYTLSTPVVKLNRAISGVKTPQKEIVHEMIPNTKWIHTLPCGQFFNEQAEFEKSKSCANKYYQNDQISNSIIPRCYVISAASPDVYSSESGEIFNFVPVSSSSGIAAVVGVYEPFSRTIFLVENRDLSEVYRHELQHFFLHHMDPQSLGAGHHQEIWTRCEPRYYRSKRFTEAHKGVDSIAK